MVQKRDYQEVIDRVNEIRKNFSVHEIGTVTYEKTYPIFLIQTIGTKYDGIEDVFFSGGVHPDEEAGVKAVLTAFENPEEYLNRYPNRRFFAIPCVNPSGYELGTLETQGRNLNRFFGVKIKSETEIVTDCLETFEGKFLFTMDFHETNPSWQGDGMDEPEQFPKETWIYETQQEKFKRVGPKLIAELPKDTPVCQWPEIYGDQNINGVISYPEGCCNPTYLEGTTLDGYLNKHNTPHSFTTETPKGWTLEKRVRTHLSYLQSALRHIKPQTILKSGPYPPQPRILPE